MGSPTVRVSSCCRLGGSPHCICVLTPNSDCVGQGAKVSGVGMKATVHDLGLLCRTAKSFKQILLRQTIIHMLNNINDLYDQLVHIFV